MSQLHGQPERRFVRPDRHRETGMGDQLVTGPFHPRICRRRVERLAGHSKVRLQPALKLLNHDVKPAVSSNLLPGDVARCTAGREFVVVTPPTGLGLVGCIAGA